ncbi:MFS transporter, partial [Mycobacterium intracellulare subsp. chimaera]
YNTIVGAGILVGNLATGSIFGAAQRLSAGALVWGGLVLIGIIATVALHHLNPARSAGPAFSDARVESCPSEEVQAETVRSSP